MGHKYQGGFVQKFEQILINEDDPEINKILDSTFDLDEFKENVTILHQTRNEYAHNDFNIDLEKIPPEVLSELAFRTKVSKQVYQKLAKIVSLYNKKIIEKEEQQK